MSESQSAPAPATVNFEGAGGLRLRGDAWGRPQDRPVLFLHGGGQTRHSWGQTARILGGEGWYSVALDLRGHGDSEWDDNCDYHLDTFAEDVVRVIGDLGRAPVLVGASLGGMTSMLIAGGEHRELCAGIVLVDITPRPEMKGVKRVLDFMRAGQQGFDSYEAAAAAISTYNPHRNYSQDISGLEKVLRKRDDGKLYWHWDPEVIADRYIFKEADYERFRVAAQGITVPTLLVRGKETDVVSEGGVKEFLEYVPHAEFVDVAGAGHMVAGDRNDAFSEAVVNFMRGLPDSLESAGAAGG